MFCDTHKHNTAMSLDTRFFKQKPYRNEVKILIYYVLRKEMLEKVRYAR